MGVTYSYILLPKFPFFIPILLHPSYYDYHHFYYCDQRLLFSSHYYYYCYYCYSNDED